MSGRGACLLPVLTYDFLQLVRLPAYWPAGCQRCRRLLRQEDGGRSFALIRHDDDDDDGGDDDGGGGGDDDAPVRSLTHRQRDTGTDRERESDLPPRCQLAAQLPLPMSSTRKVTAHMHEHAHVHTRSLALYESMHTLVVSPTPEWFNPFVTEMICYG